jgi:hypothetical protein
MRVLIFDYDDTLFPSSHIAQHELYNSDINSMEFAHHREAFLELESAAIAVLTKAISVGDLVVIVTNGKLDWIKYSMKMFYHRFFEFVRKHDTPIVSAQDIFSSRNPHPTMWKVHCFQHLLASLFSTNNAPTLLISVGDGAHEAIACEVAAKGVGISYRNVILLETPSPKQMAHQLYILVQELNSVIDHQADKVDFTATVVSGGNIEYLPISKDIVVEENPTFSAINHVPHAASALHTTQTVMS